MKTQKDNMKIIGCEAKGNLFLLTLEDDNKLKYTVEYAASYDWNVYCPNVGSFTSQWTAREVQEQVVPCVIIVKPEDVVKCKDFDTALGIRNAIKIYIGDIYTPRLFTGLTKTQAVIPGFSLPGIERLGQ